MLQFLFVVGCSMLIVGPAQATQSPVGQDPVFTNLYFNKNVFKNGLFNEQRVCQVPAERLPESLIAWDLNGVVFQKEYSLTDNIAELIAAQGYLETARLLYTFGKLYAYKLYLKSQNDPRGFVWDAIFSSLETSEAGKKDAQTLRYFAQKANHLDFAIVGLLKELKDRGHSSVVLSNMGQKLADAQVELLEAHIATLTEDSEEKTASQSALEFLTQSSNVIASQENGWLHKPDRASYQTCLDKNPATHNSDHITIFIDDKKRNIDAAVADGLFDIAISYQNADNLKAIFVALALASVAKAQTNTLPTDSEQLQLEANPQENFV